MKLSTHALSVLLVAANPFASAFAPASFTRSVGFSNSNQFKVANIIVASSHGRLSSSHLNLSSPSGYVDGDDEDEDDEDEDDEEEDDEDEDYPLSSYGGAKSPFTGMILDPNDPNPVIRRPSKYFTDDSNKIPDDQLVQTMSASERKENLAVMRQIQKFDLQDLQMRRDHAGWVEANTDLERRQIKDPWYGVNARLREAIQLGEEEAKIEALKELAARLGGPPEGVSLGPRGYAFHTEIFDIGMSETSTNNMLEFELRNERAARGRAMMMERLKKQEKDEEEYQEDLRNPGVREDREAKIRRERSMKRLMGEIEEDNKKKKERAKEILGKIPDMPGKPAESIARALKLAEEDVKKIRREKLGKVSKIDDDDDDSDSASSIRRLKSSADKAREAATAEAAGGRPRLPGDKDVTRGELGSLVIESSSSTKTGPLTVEVTSTYNKEQSDPPMRKHCFQYTIRITNNSETDTIQLLGRRFEIQTVGSSMKDVVQGEGVTGRQPILKPGEVFEYTSTAPLSVRPIGTTIIAARMSGEYRYIVLNSGQETATAEQVEKGGDSTAALGMFHFVFPESQQVVPFKRSDADEDDEDDDDEDDDDVSVKGKSSPTSARPVTKTPSAVPASSLPGDEDIKTGDITVTLNDASDSITSNVRVQVTSSYRPERSDAGMEKHCFAYNIRITNESFDSIQLVSRRFEIQTIGSVNKDVVQGPGVTGRQPILKPGESFEYTSTAPLSVRPMAEKTPVVARMQGEYNFVVMGADGQTPISSSPLQAKLGMFHFILPSLVA